MKNPPLKMQDTQDRFPQRSLKNTKRFFPLVAVVLLIGLGVAVGAAYYYYSQLANIKLNPQKIIQKETQELIEKVSKLIVLPADEQPTIATVTDPEKLKDQPFFAKAKKGNIVLIYTNARKAILYDPLENKIVEVAPINIGDEGETAP